MYRDIQMIRAIMYLAMVLVIGVACFNHRFHAGDGGERPKRRHRGAAHPGAKDGFIRAIFIWYGLLAGLLGSLGGVVIGSPRCSWTNIIRGIEKLVGHSFLSGDIYFIDFSAFRAALAGRADRVGDRHRAEPVGQLVSGEARQPHRSGAGAHRTIKPRGGSDAAPFFLAWGWVKVLRFRYGRHKIELGVFDDNLQRIW